MENEVAQAAQMAHAYGWLSLVPPVVAIVLAIATRRVVISLMVGAILGAFIVGQGNVLASLPIAFESFFWKSLVDEDHLRVFAFTLLMGAMVGVVYRAGGMHGVVDCLTPLAQTRRGGQLTTWLLGLVVFFDDYANTLLLGGTMKPLADRLKIAREKLAYLVDSTAAPVAGLAIISTWVAGEIDYIETGYKEVGMTAVNGFDIFVQTIAYRFYVLFALLFVPMVALTRRDFGPMLAAERDAIRGIPSSNSIDHDDPLEKDVPAKWYNAVVPITALIVVTVWILLVTGGQSIIKYELEWTWFNLLTQGDSNIALVYGSLVGLTMAAVMAWGQGILTAEQVRDAAAGGAKHVLPALAILWMAWSLSMSTGSDYLNTGEFLGRKLDGSIPLWTMPTVVFLLASVVAFSTGTSWGTMGLLMPLVVSTLFKMLSSGGEAVDPTDTLMIATIGSVLAGAIFGDHCSPISDTTVLSSHASGCDHVAHVWTQMPYAILVGAVSIFCGTLPVGLGVSVWVLLPIGVIVMLASLFIFGKRAEDDAESENAFVQK